MQWAFNQKCRALQDLDLLCSAAEDPVNNPLAFSVYKRLMKQLIDTEGKEWSWRDPSNLIANDNWDIALGVVFAGSLGLARVPPGPVYGIVFVGGIYISNVFQHFV